MSTTTTTPSTTTPQATSTQPQGRAVVPPPAEIGTAGSPTHWPAPAEGGTGTGRIRHRMRAGVAELRFVSERPPSLLEHVAYAQRGEWTQEIDGGRRHAAMVFAWLVAVPLSTAAYFVAWAAARPGRLGTVLVVGLLVSTALAQIPGVGWLIPSWVRL